MKKTTAYLAVLFLFENISYGQFEKLRELQQKFTDDERTGSNVMMVFQNGKTIYRHTQNSGKKGVRTFKRIPSSRCIP